MNIFIVFSYTILVAFLIVLMLYRKYLTSFFYYSIISIVRNLYRGVEQLAARWAHNPKVDSSSLSPATIFERF